MQSPELQALIGPEPVSAGRNGQLRRLLCGAGVDCLLESCKIIRIVRRGAEIGNRQYRRSGGRFGAFDCKFRRAGRFGIGRRRSARRKRPVQCDRLLRRFQFPQLK